MGFSLSNRSVKTICAAVVFGAALFGVVLLLGNATSNYESATFDEISSTRLIEEVGFRKEILPDMAASTIGEVSFESEWKNDLNVVHVVNTRFMQDQAKLKHLSNARLDLFKTFTIPSMMQQTNKQFLWLIWVDPELEESLLREFLEAVAPLRNVVVLASEQAPETNLRTLYGHSQSPITWMRSIILLGDSGLLADYYTASKTHLLLETVLDADDALSKSFIESAQAEASYAIGQDIENDSTMVQTFCPEFHAEWRFYTPNQEQNDEGHLVQMSNRHFCIGSGVSLAYHVEGAPRRMEACTVAAEHPDCRRRSLSAQRELACGGGGRQLGVVGAKDDPETEKCYPLQDIPNGAQSAIEGPLYDDLEEEFECPDDSMICQGRDETGEFTEDSLFSGDDITYPIGSLLRFQCMPKKCQSDVLFFDVIIRDYSSVSGYEGHVCEFSIDYVGVKNATKSKICHDFNTERDYKVTRTWVKEIDLILNLEDVFFQYNPTTVEIKRRGGGDVMGGIHVEDFFFVNGIKEFTICVAPVEPPPERFCRNSFRLLPEDVDSDDIVRSSKPLEASVLLSRTPTAAGMKHVVSGDNDRADTGGQNSVAMATYGNITHDSVEEFEHSQTTAWESIEKNFGVDREEIKALRGRFVDNMEHILLDAFNGQCTPGHSCKESTKRALGYLMDRVHG